MMKYLLKLSFIFFLIFIGVSCSNDDEPTTSPIITFKADLQTEGASYPYAGQGGDAVAILNQTEKTIQITVNYNSLAPFTVIKINVLNPIGPDGNYGTQLLDFSDKIGPTSTSKTFILNDEQIATIMAGHCYVLVYLYYDDTLFGTSLIGGELKKAITN